MEIEYFVPADADGAMKFFEQRKNDSMHYRTEIIGINAEHLKFRDHDKLAHYAAAATDIEYDFPRGFGEIQGIHNRTDFDLTQHQEHSKTSMQYTDPKSGQRYIPRCIEASTGLGRQVMVTMLEFYDEEEIVQTKTESSEISEQNLNISGRSENSTNKRVVIRFPFQIAPIKYAILPLMEKDETMVDLGRQVFNKLRKKFYCEFDTG
jgi:glycyl-tRNA synthetase